jgi:hypothetical protein
MPVSETLPTLSPDIARHTVHTVTGLLPRSAADTPEDHAAADASAIAAVAVLRPADAFEAELAARIVGANAHALDCLNAAATAYLGNDAAGARHSRAQAGLMMRQADSALRFLERRQAPRTKAEPAPEEATQPAADAAAPPADIALEADRYALSHRKRATLIRRLGRLPDRVACGALTPEMVRTIVTGASPILQALDVKGRQRAIA